MSTAPGAPALELASSCHPAHQPAAQYHSFIDTPSAEPHGHSRPISELARTFQLLPQLSCLFQLLPGSSLFWMYLSAKRDLRAWPGGETRAKLILCSKFRAFYTKSRSFLLADRRMPLLCPAVWLLKCAQGGNIAGKMGEAFSEGWSISLESVYC